MYTHTHTHTYLQFSRPSLVVQWLRLQASTSGVMGSIPSWGTKIPHACLVEQCPQKGLCYDLNFASPHSHPDSHIEALNPILETRHRDN